MTIMEGAGRRPFCLDEARAGGMVDCWPLEQARWHGAM